MTILGFTGFSKTNKLSRAWEIWYFWSGLFLRHSAETYSEISQIPKMELSQKQLTLAKSRKSFRKSSILDVSQSSE